MGALQEGCTHLAADGSRVGSGNGSRSGAIFPAAVYQHFCRPAGRAVRFWLLLTPLLSGCAALTKGGITATAAGVGAGLGSVAGGPAGAAAGGALAGGITTAVLSVGGSSAAAVVAPDTIFSVAQRAVEIGGIGLLAIIIAPLILGWLMPGPLERKRAPR